MKSVIIAQIILALFVVFATAQRKAGEFTKVEGEKFCKRNLAARVGAGGDTVTLTSTAVCAGANRDPKRAKSIEFSISSALLPAFQFRSRSFAETDKGVAGKFFVTKLGFDKIIAYREVNATAGLGYQEGTDVVVGQYFLDELRNGRSTKWSKIQREQTDLGNDVKVNTLFMNLERGYQNIENIEFGIDITPQEVEIKSANASRTRTILTPNSFKLTLNVSGISNLPAGTSGIAIGAFLMVKGGVRRNNVTRTPVDKKERVNEATNEQGVINVADDENPKETGAFFSWKKFVDAVKKGRTSSEQVNLISSETTTLASNSRNGITADAGFTLKRIWFSIPDPDITSFVWDPALGAFETETSASSASVFSASLIILSVISYFLF